MENLVGRMNVVPQKEIAAVVKGHLLYPTPGYRHQEYFWPENGATQGKAAHWSVLEFQGYLTLVSYCTGH